MNVLDLLYKHSFILDPDLREKCRDTIWVNASLQEMETKHISLWNINHILHVNMFANNTKCNTLITQYIERYNRE